MWRRACPQDGLHRENHHYDEQQHNQGVVKDRAIIGSLTGFTLVALWSTSPGGTAGVSGCMPSSSAYDNTARTIMRRMQIPWRARHTPVRRTTPRKYRSQSVGRRAHVNIGQETIATVVRHIVSTTNPTIVIESDIPSLVEICQDVSARARAREREGGLTQ